MTHSKPKGHEPAKSVPSPVPSVPLAPVVSVTEPILLKAEQVARMLGLARNRVYLMMSQGQLPTVRIGSRLRIPKVALLDWVQKSTNHPA